MIINDLVARLYSDKLLSGNHKDCIDSLATSKEKTEYLLDKVIKPSLAIKYTKQKHLGCKKRRGQSEAAVI